MDNPNIFTLQEFDFPHCVALHEQGLKGDALLGQYRKCFTTLELDHHPGMIIFFKIL